VVKRDPDAVRRAKFGNSQLGFADAYPFLITSWESHDELDRRVGMSFPINRFRPSMVIAGGDAHDEDRFGRIVTSGGVEFEGKTLCERCPVPMIDQETAVMGKEPNKTLATYRRGRHLKDHPYLKPNAVYFGRNCNHLSTGTISVGDLVESL
jgi:uncharacterized protein YcbX